MLVFAVKVVSVVACVVVVVPGETQVRVAADPSNQRGEGHRPGVP